MKAVIYDMDGVVLNTEVIYTQKWLELGRQRNFKNVESFVDNVRGCGVKESLELINSYDPDIDAQAYSNDVFAAVDAVAYNYVELMPYLKESLKFFKDHKFKIALATSTNRERVDHYLKMHDIDSYFDVIVCGDEIEKNKPNPDIFLKAMQKLNVEAKDTYILEDSYNGIRAALASKAHPFMVVDQNPVTEEMEEKAEKIFNNLKEVFQFFTLEA